MGVLDLVKKGFEVALKSKPLVIVLFAFSFVWNLINMPLQNQTNDPGVGVSFSVIVLSLIVILIGIFMHAGTLGYVRDMVKSGQSNLVAFKEYGIKYYVRILGIQIILFLLAMVIIAVGALIMVILGFLPSILKVAIGAILVIGGIVVVIFLALAPYATVADESGVFDALKSSIEVVKSLFWKFILTALLVLVMLFALGLMLTIVVGLLSGLLGGTLGQIISGLLGSLLNAYFSVVLSGTFMSLYLATKASSPSESTPS